MQIPFHPLIAQFPMAMAFLLPPLVVVFAYFIRVNKLSTSAWLIIVGLQLATTVTGYMAIDSGVTEEKMVERAVPKVFVSEHEAAANIFIGLTVLGLVLSVAGFFLRKDLQLYVQVFILGIVISAAYMGYRVVQMGHELVYLHGAAKVYHHDSQVDEATPEGLLPTPGLETSENPFPTDENESLKADENDYGSADEENEPEDEEIKQED